MSLPEKREENSTCDNESAEENDAHAYKACDHGNYHDGPQFHIENLNDVYIKRSRSYFSVCR